jgi:hypothetical protein
MVPHCCQLIFQPSQARAPREVPINGFRRTTMKTVDVKLILSTLGIVAMLTSPAFAQKLYRRPSQQTTQFQAPVEQYPNGATRTGSASSQFDQDHGYYSGN